MGLRTKYFLLGYGAAMGGLAVGALFVWLQVAGTLQ